MSDECRISKELFMALCRYHLTTSTRDQDEAFIHHELERKLKKLAEHDDYTRYLAKKREQE